MTLHRLETLQPTRAPYEAHRMAPEHMPAFVSYPAPGVVTVWHEAGPEHENALRAVFRLERRGLRVIVAATRPND